MSTWFNNRHGHSLDKTFCEGLTPRLNRSGSFSWKVIPKYRMLLPRALQMLE